MAESTETGKKTKGRQKIEIRQIKNPDERSITFSKRRSGIYKKASELVTLCGAEVGVMFFSPGGKPFTYGYPSISAIIDRYFENALTDQFPRQFSEARHRSRMEELNRRHNQLKDEMEALKQREAALRKMMARRKGKKKEQDWWDVPVEDLCLEQLQTAESAILKTVRDMGDKIKERSVGLGVAGYDAGCDALKFRRIYLKQRSDVGSSSDGGN